MNTVTMDCSSKTQQVGSHFRLTSTNLPVTTNSVPTGSPHGGLPTGSLPASLPGLCRQRSVSDVDNYSTSPAYLSPPVSSRLQPAFPDCTPSSPVICQSTQSSSGHRRRSHNKVQLFTSRLSAAISRQTSEPKSSRSSLAGEKIMESVVFKPSSSTPSPEVQQSTSPVVGDVTCISPLQCDSNSSPSSPPGVSPTLSPVRAPHLAVLRRSHSQGQTPSQYTSSDVITPARSVSPAGCSSFYSGSPNRQTDQTSTSFFNGFTAEPPYSSESYLVNRATPTRCGFGGNYRRSNSTTSSTMHSDVSSSDMIVLRQLVTSDEGGRVGGTWSMPGTLDKHYRTNRKDTVTPHSDVTDDNNRNDVTDGRALSPMDVNKLTPESRDETVNFNETSGGVTTKSAESRDLCKVKPSRRTSSAAVQQQLNMDGGGADNKRNGLSRSAGHTPTGSTVADMMTVKKADSFDSGIDTKTESYPTRVSVDDQEEQQQTPASSDVTDSVANSPRVLPLTEVEMRFERLATLLVSRIDPVEDMELCRVLAPAESRDLTTATDYMQGVFDNLVRPIRTGVTSRDTDECLTHLDSDELKTQLLAGVRNKLQTLDTERQTVTTKLQQIQQLNNKLTESVQCKLTQPQFNKFKLYVDELHKVLRLCLMLATRLVRNDVSVTSPPVTPSSDSPRQSKKQGELLERFNEAVLLKFGIDRRRAPLESILQQVLPAEQLQDFRTIVDTSCSFQLDLQWLDDRFQLSQRQHTAIMNHILDSSTVTEC